MVLLIQQTRTPERGVCNETSSRSEKDAVSLRTTERVVEQTIGASVVRNKVSVAVSRVLHQGPARYERNDRSCDTFDLRQCVPQSRFSTNMEHVVDVPVSDIQNKLNNSEK